jgi:hypothetical protein
MVDYYNASRIPELHQLSHLLITKLLEEQSTHKITHELILSFAQNNDG